MLPKNTVDTPTQHQKDVTVSKQAEKSFKAGKFLAAPSPGEEVVITGMAGRFPESDDVYKYRDNILNKVDMVSNDDRRWKHTNPEIPHRSGKINFLEKFDAGAFGVCYQQAYQMDPQCRLVIEHAFEAVLDAGYHPQELRGTRTGVFIGTCLSETEKSWLYDNLKSPSYGILGCLRSMQANWISYVLGLEGPSCSVDTACGSSLTALDYAYRAIRSGRCDSALVGGTNLCLLPSLALQSAKLGVLSVDGSCKSFDRDANGYVRSEAVSVIFLQKSKDARRIYAQVTHSKTNSDGYKEQGITFPSSATQKQLLDEVYQECNVDPATIDFFEAHATGTKVGDPEEIQALDEVFCVNRKAPLYVGSVKSNIGHTEPASGLCSVVKVLLGMEIDCLLPNINFSNPREGAVAIEKGRMVVVTETTPWPKSGSGYAAVNSFGFGGSNCHVLLKRSTKKKINNGQPMDDLPRLVCVSGRTKDSVASILDDINTRPLDTEFVRLFHEIFKNDIPGHSFRGYMIVSKMGELSRSLKRFGGQKLPLCLLFSGPNESLSSVGRELSSVPLFAATIQNIHDILSPKGINVKEIVSQGFFNNSVDVIIASVAIQAALMNVLKILGLFHDYIIGYSTGELVAAYADDALTLEQTVLIAYYVRQSLRKMNSSRGAIATYRVELKENESRLSLPNNLEIIGYSSEKNFTISGPSQIITNFVNRLENKVVTVDEVQDYTGLHSTCLAKICPELFQHLKEVIPKPRRRSSKWITSLSKKQSINEASAYASAEYFLSILLNPLVLNGASTKLSRRSVLLEIGAGFTNVQDFNHVNLTTTGNDKKGCVYSILRGLGSLYKLGYNMKLDKLYPKVQWPVSNNTPMISPLIRWDHTDDWKVTKYEVQQSAKFGERMVSFSVKHSDWRFISGHVIDGKTLIPATSYLYMVWETLSMIVGVLMSDLQVIFENVRFCRAVAVPKYGVIPLTVMVHKQTGTFEVRNLSETVATGRIHIPEDFSLETVKLPVPLEKESPVPFTTKDIYKELSLRGYNFTGHFRGLRDCDLSAQRGSVEWNGNWVAFMHDMLLLKLLQEDTRNLYVLVGIDRLAIDPRAHVLYAQEFGKNPVLPIYAHKGCDIIKSGGIEVRGMLASFIPRRKPRGAPVLEIHKFVPFECDLPLEQSVRVLVQIVVENCLSIKFRAVELVDEATKEGATPLGSIIHQALSDQPLIQPEVVVLSKESLELTNVTVEQKPLSAENRTCSLVIVSDIFSRQEIKQQAVNALKKYGCILSREESSFDVAIAENDIPDFDVLAVYQTDKEKLVLLRKPVKLASRTLVDISDSLNFDWLFTMKTALKNNKKVTLLAQNAPLNGILGFVNCLRREPDSSNVQCIFVLDDEAPKFDVNSDFYSKQLNKGLTVNIFKDSKWGTYRHLLLEKTPLAECEHIYNDALVKGDLSSLKWIEGPLTSKSALLPGKMLVYIYFAGLNFRDVMNATGHNDTDAITRNRLKQFNLQGLEFSGRDSRGRRVMGMTTCGALASMIDADAFLTWEIPDFLSMEEAATIPVAYGTVLLALNVIAEVKVGQSILIHAGSGDVGQAAINVALYYKCEIFTTVGTQEQRGYITKTFPQILVSHIGNSRDTSFEQMIFKETNGRGVDIVLNSLVEEKLQASVRCLAPGGKFLEIGKFDMANNNPVGLKSFNESRSFHGIALNVFVTKKPSTREIIGKLLIEGLTSGMIKPLSRITFQENDVEKAFRYMADEKQMGKIVIKLREEESEKEVIPEFSLFKGFPRFYGNPDNSYIICGGLGGFGLELVDWLVNRGVRKLVLVSRSGLKNGYQASRIRIWKSYDATIKVSTLDITTKEGCAAIIEEANKLGPVEGIFNLAVLLKDAMFENQNEESFVTSLKPKAVATRNLDVVSREMCPQIRYFIVFSSSVCGRGNIGQTNYGMANSIMERICEQRKKDGYPALAIQWGTIGEVGLAADMQEFQMEIEICGILQQRITSCLEVMDTFLRQDEPIVSSIVVSKKKRGMGRADNITDAVKNVLGMRDLNTISRHATLSELGMDSMMAVEIKQTLEREYEVLLTARDIRTMTFARLKKIEDKETLGEETQKNKNDEKEKLSQGLGLLLRCVGDEENADIPMVRLPSLVKEKSMAPKIFLLPGIDGMANILEPLAANLVSHVFCLQFTCTDQLESTIQDIAKSLLPSVQEALSQNTPFTIVAYSYGSLVAMELAALLEADGRMGRIVLIDGAPAMLKQLVKQQIPETNYEPLLQTLTLCTLMHLRLPSETVLKHQSDILNCKTFEERVEMVLGLAPKDVPYSEEYQRITCITSYHRIKSLLFYQPAFRKLKSLVKLFKPSRPTIKDFDEDYKLHELCEYPVEVSTFEGHHWTILKNLQVASAINAIADTTSMYFKESTMKDTKETKALEEVGTAKR